MLDDAADLYQSLIMQRARTPRHAGKLEAFDAEGEGENPMCGDRVHLWIRRDGEGRIAEFGHKTRGCAICQASADLLGDAALGMSGAELARLNRDFNMMLNTGTAPDPVELGDLQALSGVHEYRSRIRCATLPWQALVTALGVTELASEVRNG